MDLQYAWRYSPGWPGIESLDDAIRKNKKLSFAFDYRQTAPWNAFDFRLCLKNESHGRAPAAEVRNEPVAA